MKRLLKYLLPLIVAAAFAGSTDGAACQFPSVESSVLELIDETVCATELSTADSELCLPRQVSFANHHQVQRSARRTGNSQRTNFEFTKSGKVINAGIRYFVQKQSVVTHSRLTDSAALLHSLGRLII